MQNTRGQRIPRPPNAKVLRPETLRKRESSSVKRNLDKENFQAALAWGYDPRKERCQDALIAFVGPTG